MTVEVESSGEPIARRFPHQTLAWVVAVVGPLLVELVLGMADEPRDLIPGAWLLAVTAVVALLGGLRPAVLATLVAGFVLAWELPPRHELALDAGVAVGLAGFVACAAGIIGLVALVDAARHRAERAARALERIEQTTFALSHLGSMGVMEGVGETVTEANDALLEMLGLTRDDLEAGRVTWPGMTAPGWEEVDTRAMAELVSDGRTGPYEKAYRHADGSDVPALVAATLLSKRPFRWAAFVADLGDLHAMQREVLDHADQTLELARRIIAAPGVDELAEVAANRVASTLGARFSYFGALRGDHLAVSFHESMDPVLAAEVSSQPLGVAAAGAMVVRTGRTQRAHTLAEIHERYPLFSAELERLGVHQLIVMPVRGTGGVVVGFVGVGFGPEQVVDVATEARLALVAELCGLTLQRALLYEREHDVSATLQFALLGELPSVERVEAVSRYLPATLGVQIGGDLVDVVDRSDGRVVAVVGDVVGHGLQAAATMGQLRAVVRVLARSEAGPADVIDGLAPFLEDVRDACYSTLVVAFLDPAAGELTYASAGHPPAVLHDDDGTRQLDRAQNRLLGVRGAPHEERVEPWRAGSTLVLYTDGLVETRTTPVTEGIERLVDAVADLGDEPLDRVADGLLERLAPARFDDTALLVLRAR